MQRLVTAAKDGQLVTGVRRRFRKPEAWYRWRLGLSYTPGTELPSFSMQGDFSGRICTLVKQAFDEAVSNVSKLPNFVRDIDGMSGQKYRSFINNLVNLHPDARYLEIGSWGGSTAAAAMYGNSVDAVCIDNWSQFGGPRDTFFANMESVRSPAMKLRVVESDFRKVDFSSLGCFNLFLFDGLHEEADQYDGIIVARPALEKSFVLIVDDWNWRSVRIGTFRALIDAQYSVICSIEIRTTSDNSHPRLSGKKSDWHNGYFISALETRDRSLPQ